MTAYTAPDHFVPDEIVRVRRAYNTAPLVAVEVSTDVSYLTPENARHIAQGLLVAANEAERLAGSL